MLRFSFLLVIFPCITALSCGDCTHIGCENNTAIELTVTSAQGLSPGTYVFTVTTDVSSSMTLTCDAPPNLDCWGCYGYIASFYPDGAPGAGVGGMLCTGDGGAGSSPIGLLILDRPRTITIEVTRDGVHLATRTLTPRYVTYKPNGPDCGCTSTQAEPMTLTLSL